MDGRGKAHKQLLDHQKIHWEGSKSLWQPLDCSPCPEHNDASICTVCPRIATASFVWHRRRQRIQRKPERFTAPTKNSCPQAVSDSQRSARRRKSQKEARRQNPLNILMR